MTSPSQDVECPECNGVGYSTESGHGCDGSNEMCSRTCPVPVQRQCEFCGGSGVVEVAAPIPNEPSDDIKTGKPIETSFDRTRREVQSHETSDMKPKSFRGDGKPIYDSISGEPSDSPKPTQDDVFKFVTDPETIKRAAEGSMQKRQEVIDRSAIGDEPVFSKALLEYYWGKDWPGLKSHYSDGTPVKPENRGYPKWERYSDEQKEEILGLHRLIEEQTKLARIDERAKVWYDTVTSYRPTIDLSANAFSANFAAKHQERLADLEASIKERSEDE